MFQEITQLVVAPSIHWTEAFGAWLHLNDRSPSTVSAYLQDVRHFADHFLRENGSEFFPQQLNATDVKSYFRWQDGEKSIAPASRNRRLATLRVLVRWAVEEGLLDYDPTVSIKRQPVEPSPRDRSHAEMDALNAVVGAGSHLKCKTENHVWLGLRDRVIWILFNSAGLRISEVASLEVRDLDFSANVIHVLGKGKKKARVEVKPEAMAEVAEWLNMRGVASSVVISDWDGKPLSRGQVWRRIKMIGQSAKVGDLKPHDLRHTYAYSISDALKKQGLPEQAVSNGVRKQMRHGDEKTTRLYFGVRVSQIRAAVEAM